MLPKLYNFKPLYAGDTWPAIQFKIKRKENETVTPINIDGVAIAMQVRKGENGPIILEFSNSNGITIIDAANGVFKINSFEVPKINGCFKYDLQFSYPNGEIHTYLYGEMNIKNDITV